jgi:phosphohistidine phosphatase
MMRDAITYDGFDLSFVRHGDAGDPDAWSGAENERPLSAEGRGQSERLGRHLAAVGFTVEALVTSPKVRARETATIVGDLLGVRPRVDERLAEGVTLEVVEQILAERGRLGSALLVGHDPEFSDVVSELCGANGLSLRKGALARLTVSRPLAAGRAKLRWLLPPDALGNA